MTEPLITSRTDWSEELIEKTWRHVEAIAKDVLEVDSTVDCYPNQFEIVSAEQMLDAYSSIGLPVNYNHWSFGKDFLRNYAAYQRGHMGLALEMVINTQPCINYLMEDNDMLAQAMVIAHAGIGHNAVFKNNDYFKQWTDATSIIDYMVFAKEYVRRCEERYGTDEVEAVIDAAHCLASHGVDKFKRKHRPKISEEQHLKNLIEEDDRRQRELDIVIKKTTIEQVEPDTSASYDDPEKEENLLYYIMKKSPSLEQWKREILRIVYKINSYFYPQGGTKVLNEGYATFCHFHIMKEMEERGIISPDAYISFLHLHSSVIYQPTYNSPHWSGINPYALGFAIFQDLKRICEEPTDEDREWFPQLIGRRWQEVTKEAAFGYRDDSFIAQFLSPKVIRDLGMFSVEIRPNEDEGYAIGTVTEIHDDEGYKNIRNKLSQYYERVNFVPQIEVIGSDLEGDRTLYLQYIPFRERELDRDDAELVVQAIDYLWGYKVHLKD